MAPFCIALANGRVFASIYICNQSLEDGCLLGERGPGADDGDLGAKFSCSRVKELCLSS